MRGSAHVHLRVFERKLEIKLNGAISDVQFKPSVIVRIGNRGAFHVLVNAEMIEAAACDMVLCSNPTIPRITDFKKYLLYLGRSEIYLKALCRIRELRPDAHRHNPQGLIRRPTPAVKGHL